MVKFARTISKSQTELSLQGFAHLSPQSLSQQADLSGTEMRKQLLDEMQKKGKLHKKWAIFLHLQKKGNGLGILFYDDEQVMVVGEEGGGHKPFFYIIWKKECIGRTKIIIDILNIIFGGNGLLHAFNP